MFVAADTAMGANAPTCIVNYLDTGGGAGATTTFTSTASDGHRPTAEHWRCGEQVQPLSPAGSR
jgi:hypothetical protein